MATSVLKKITPADIGAAANSAAMQFRGWYPNGQSMLSLTPGYYRTNPGALPSETFPNGISAYGTLCVDDTGYTHIIYISVLGDFMFWKSNSNEWYIVQYQGRVPIASGGTGATTKLGACENIGAVNNITDTNRRFTSKSVNDAPLGLAAFDGSNSNVTQKPYSFWFDVFTFKSIENNYIRQIAVPWSNNRSIAFRTQTNGTWNSWRYIATQTTEPTT